LAASGGLSPQWTAATLIVAIGMALLAARALVRSWRFRAERLEAVAASLTRRSSPSHLVPNDNDVMSRAERRLLEAADAVINELRSSARQRAEFEAILRSMTEGVVVTGSRREIVLLNGAARRIFGLSAEGNYQGRDFVELCRDPRVQEFVRRATASERSEVLSAELQMQIPAPRVFEVNGAPVHQPPAVAAQVFVFHDISRLKSYETVRTDFIANLTHELRTPLTALYGYTETLLKGVDDRDTEQRFLNIIARQSRRLARLIDDLVSLSDLERGLTPLKFESLAPGQVLEEAAELMHEQARANGVALKIEYGADLPPISADRDRLQQVMINLLDNALKYTPRGGSVHLRSQRSFGGIGDNQGIVPEGVEFVVADTGDGIPANHIPRLTERFYRVDRARSRELGGTGLGLAIVKHIVQLHNGVLRIESRVREGTTITVWIPCDAREAPSSKSGEQSIKEPGPDKSR
jgi:two-component system phosphate regulon sensor histidine kinase PhoR